MEFIGKRMGHKLKQLFLRLWGELPESVFIIIILRVGTCACSLACFQNMLKSRVYNFIPGGRTTISEMPQNDQFPPNSILLQAGLVVYPVPNYASW